MAQLTVLALLAARVPLAARMPSPVEQYAGCAVAATALIVAALSGRALFSTPVAAVRTMATALPLTTLAALAAGCTPALALAGGTIVVAWLGAFSAVFQGRFGRSPTLQSAVLAACVVVPAVFYLSREFGPVTRPASTVWTLFSPVLGTCPILPHLPPAWRLFGVQLVVPVVIALCPLAIAWRRRKIYTK
jgi:hypothetical protein